MTAEAIDLTLLDSEEDVESPSAAAAREVAQRQRIMDSARAKRQRTDGPSSSGGGGGGQAADAAPATGDQAGPSGVDRAAAAAAAGAGDAAGTSGGAGAGGVSAAAGFGNNDLRALHEARMQRQRAQEAATGGAAGADDAAGSSKSAAGNQGGGSQQQGGRSGGAAKASTQAATAAGTSSQGAGGSSRSGPITLLTYNVWFKEEVALRERMQGIASIIASSGYPTFICLQEVTANILRLFSSMAWWQRYACSPVPFGAPYFTLLLVNKAAAPSVSNHSFEEVAFDNSCMGRSLRTATVTVGGRTLLVATSHLESPIPPDNWFSKERKQQMAFSLHQLAAAPYGNILFAGDMNWTDSREGVPALPPGWCDAWQQLHPWDAGYTYDAKSNDMLPYKNTPPLRLDRIFAKLSDYRPASISIVGKEALGSSYTHKFRSGGSKQLPVLPSDHYGLLLQLEEV